jgi:hypothetical protein
LGIQKSNSLHVFYQKIPYILGPNLGKDYKNLRVKQSIVIELTDYKITKTPRFLQKNGDFGGV